MGWRPYLPSATTPLRREHDNRADEVAMLRVAQKEIDFGQPAPLRGAPSAERAPLRCSQPTAEMNSMTSLADDLLVVLLARHSDNEGVKTTLDHLRIVVRLAHDYPGNLQGAADNELSATSYGPSGLTENTYKRANQLHLAFETDALATIDTEISESYEADDNRRELRQSADRIVAVAANLARMSRMTGEY